MSKTKTLTLELDEDDHNSIQAAIAKYQAEQRIEGELSIADGEGPLIGRIVAEICRGWADYHDNWPA